MSSHDHEPQYGQRLPPQDPGTPPPAPPVSPRAARRMARGLSFTAVLLGLLLGTGLSALGLSWGWVAGALLVLPGFAGFAAVQAQLHPALRDASAPPLRSRSKLWLVPAALLPGGIVLLGGALAVEPLLTGTARADLVGEYVSVLVVSGATLVVAAGLGAGLVATASLTPRDDDDSPLRPTGYAERDRRRAVPEHYDSDWIHRRSRLRCGGDGGERPGPRDAAPHRPDRP